MITITQGVCRFGVALSISSLLILIIMHQPSHAGEPPPALNREQASAFARLALKGLCKEYPNKPEHVLSGPADVRRPRLCIRRFLARTTGTRRSMATGCSCGCSAFPDLNERAEIRSVLGAHLTLENLKVEAEYFAQGQPFVRAALRLGVAAQARPGTARLG